MTIRAKVASVRQHPIYESQISVLAETGSGDSIRFNVPQHAAGAYVIGREIKVTVQPK